MKKFYFILIITLFTAGCTTKKNTAITRFYHNLTSKYNIFFNANESFKEGLNKIDNQVKDNYTIILPIYKYTDPSSASIASSEMDNAIKKCAKLITNHSITAKPKPKTKGKLTEKDKEFYSLPEYNKWVDDSYLLMGKANFIKRDFPRSMRSFQLIVTRFKKANTRFDAMLWIAKIYIEQKQYKDAETTLSAIEKDKRHPKRLDKDIFLTFSDLYIRQEKYENARQYLYKAIDEERNKAKKARYTYILAQISQKNKNLDEAAELYKKVIKMNPPYEMAFNAKINRATTVKKEEDTKDTRKQLLKMLKDDKNIEYQDQIYFALANLEYNNGNIDKALEYYKLSAEKNISNPNQKAITYLAIADIYFAIPDYINSQAYYDSTMQYLTKKYPNYDSIANRANNLSELIKNLNEINYQDSLIRLAKMPEKQRNQIIDNIIAKVIEQEQQQEYDNTQNLYSRNDNFSSINGQNSFQSGKWYMYNPTVVANGKNEFKRKWGNRPLEDNWRRKNKRISTEFEQEIEQKKDSLKNLKSREYYLQNIPFSDSAQAVAIQKIVQAYYNAAEIYANKMNDKQQAIEMLEQLNNKYPKNHLLLDSYYLLYTLCKQTGKIPRSQYYKEAIIKQFPQSEYAKILSDPTYLSNLLKIKNKQLEQYEYTLELYNKHQYQTVIQKADSALKNNPLPELMPKYTYLQAVSYGSLGKHDTMKVILQTFIENYPNDELASLAKKQIKLIESGKYDIDIYKMTFDEKHYYILIMNYDERRARMIKFSLKDFCSTYSQTVTYTVDDQQFGKDRIIFTVEPFENKQKAMQFYKDIVSSQTLSFLLGNKYQQYVISETNLKILVQDQNTEKYNIFFIRYYLGQ